MKTTRRVLMAANAQLRAQIAACNPESRKGLRSKLAALRNEVARLELENASLRKALEEHQQPA